MVDALVANDMKISCVFSCHKVSIADLHDMAHELSSAPRPLQWAINPTRVQPRALLLYLRVETLIAFTRLQERW